MVTVIIVFIITVNKIAGQLLLNQKSELIVRVDLSTENFLKDEILEKVFCYKIKTADH